MKQFVSLAMASIVCWSASSAMGQEPDLKEIIRKVDQTTKAVKAVTYKVAVWVEGPTSTPQPKIQAEIKAKQGPTGKSPMLWIEGVMTNPASNQKNEFHAVLNEKQAAVFNEEKKLCLVGDLPDALDLVSEPLKTVVMAEFLHPTPFTDELKADSRTYQGKKIIAGIECHVIDVIYAGGDVQSRWYLGVKDNLPHRVDRYYPMSKGKLFRVLELSDLKVHSDLDDALFAINVPEDYQKREYVRPTRSSLGKSAPELLPAGDAAPDWTLQTPEGKEVVLSKLRGKIVLLDFWATWCGPCKMAMPKIQQLHEKYQGKPVVVYGVNTWERGDAAAFMKKNKYTYPLLLAGDKVAQTYGVRGIPTLYLIGPKGEILLASSWFGPSTEKKIIALIDETLKKME